MYSVGFDHGTRFADHMRNMGIAAALMFVIAQMSPYRLLTLAVPLYTLGVALLVAVAVFGLTKKGAQRWLNIGVVIQPSEIMKIAMPLMLAWWFQRREGQMRVLDFFVASLLLVIPVGLVLAQPDLGTALLILASGLFVIYFAGLSWKLIIPPLVIALIGIVVQGTQTHLEFIPERTTDFIFAAFGEEFGLVGTAVLVLGLVFLIVRGLTIAIEAPTLFARLLAGSITLNFFVYGFVNMGMVSGILPVVGVPLPFISYGGTAMVTMGLGLGILLSIGRTKRLMTR